MSILRSLSIRSRLMMLAVIVVIMNLVVVAITHMRVGQIEALFTEYDEAGVKEQLLTLQISRDMNYVSRLTRSIMLGDNYDKNFNKLTDYRALIDNHFQALELAGQKISDDSSRGEFMGLVKKSKADTLAFVNDGYGLMAQLKDQPRTQEQLQSTWNTYRKRATPLANKARASFKELLGYIDPHTSALQAQTGQELLGLNQFILSVSILSLLVIVVVIVLIGRSIQQPLNRMRDTISQSAGNNDLRLRLNDQGNDELAALAQAYDQLQEAQHQTLTQFAEAVQTLNEQTALLGERTSRAGEAADQQLRDTDQIAAAVNEMSANANEVATSSLQAAEAAAASDNQANTGKQAVMSVGEEISRLAGDVSHAAQVISQLQQNTQQIGTVVDVIRSIAEQTNLLALNAAIEAARAGDQGRGFAVVADEVRTLASRTQQSTQEINDMIQSLQGGAETAVTVMAQSSEQAQRSVEKAKGAAEALAAINDAVARINQMNTQIANASAEQTSVAEELNQRILSISDSARSVNDGTRFTDEGVQTLDGLAERLREQLARFRM